MEIAVVQPKLIAAHALPMEEVRILPISDIHYGAQGCDVDRLARHIQWGVDNDCYFLGLGDGFDLASPSNRTRFAAGAFYDVVRATMARQAERWQKELHEILAPSRGRWLGWASGHHYWPFEDGSTTDTRLAQFLETRYMGDSAAMTILHFKNVRDAKHTDHGYAKIWYHHGVGGGKAVASPLTVLEPIVRTFDADVYLIGHHHKKVATKVPRLGVRVTANDRIEWDARNLIMASTGGFLKGYEMGTHDEGGLPSGSYVEKRMLPPVSLGGIMLYIRPRVIHGRVTIDLDVSL